MTEPLATIPEVARHLKVSLSMARRMSALPTFPTLRLGRAVRFRLSEVDEWIQLRQGAHDA